MIANPFTYHAPQTLDEVFGLLASTEENGGGKILAGRHEPHTR